MNRARGTKSGGMREQGRRVCCSGGTLTVRLCVYSELTYRSNSDARDIRVMHALTP